MNQDIRLIRILRRMKWKECKRNLIRLLQTCDIMEVSRENFDIIHEKVYGFIKEMEEMEEEHLNI